VLDAVRRRLPEPALLVITHRPNAVFEADRVVRLVGGRVVSSALPVTRGPLPTLDSGLWTVGCRPWTVD